MPRLPSLDRPLALALLIASIVLLARAALISRAHSEAYDEEYHLSRGARFWAGRLHNVPLNDPPFGEALAAVPLSITNRNPSWSYGLYDHTLSPESALLLTHLWMSILFLPAIGVAFVWCRRLYGLPSAWLATALLLIEPTFAAHVPLGTLDTLGTSGILLGSYLIWRAFERPTWARVVPAAAAVGCALTLKNTALGLLLVVVELAALFWLIRPLIPGLAENEAPVRSPSRPLAVAAAVVVCLLTIWGLTGFDVSQPHPQNDWGEATAKVPSFLMHPVPGGLYWTALLQGLSHAGEGHDAFLLGERRVTGWWYYFPVVLSYKMPIGIAVVLLIGAASLLWRRPRWDELGLLIPLSVWLGLAITSHVNIGVRHFLPAYVFLLLLGTRCLAPKPPAWAPIAAWGGVALAALHVLSFHPDYLSYLNWKRDRPWMAISDSNLDWGQGLKQVRAWIDAHPMPPDRAIILLYFGDDLSERRVRHYLGDRVAFSVRPELMPQSGIVIASPVWVAGPYDQKDVYAPLRKREPIGQIGHSMLVYDLDRP